MASNWSQKITVVFILLLSGDSFLVFGSDYREDLSSLSTESSKPSYTRGTKINLPVSKCNGFRYKNGQHLAGAPDASNSRTASPSVFQTKAMSGASMQAWSHTEVNDSAGEGYYDNSTDLLEENPGLMEITWDTRITMYPAITTNGATLDTETDSEALRQEAKLKESFNVNPVDDLTTTPLDLNNGTASDQNLTFTCRGRCGLKISFPCGCSASCVVYQRCCEDMAHDCPHVLEEGRSQLGHLLTSKIVCDQDSVMKIASCPILKEERKIPKEKNYWERAKSKGHLVKKSNETVSEKLNKALWLSAPVTDKLYGFTFVNKSIYDCHRMNYSFFTWGLQLEYRYQTPINLRDLEPLLREDNPYQPLFYTRILLSHLCSQHVVRTCNNSTNSGNSGKYYENKCQKSSATLVYNISNIGKPVYYANKFCAFCNEGMHKELQIQSANKFAKSKRGLHVKVSVSLSKYYIFKPVNNLQRYPLSWIQVKCLITEAPSRQHQSSERSSGLSVNQTVCIATCEGHTFTLSPDGMCKARHIGHVAFSDDGLSQLCSSAFPRLSNFFTCGMKSLIPSLRHADFQSTSVFAYFDIRVNKTLYVLKFQADLPAPETANLADNVENIPRFAFLSNAFRHFRVSHNICSGEGKEKNIESGAKTVSNFPPMRVVLTQHVPLPTKWLQDGPTHDGHNKTTVCVSVTYLAQNGREPPLVLACSDYRVLDDGVESARAFNSSGCFDLLTEEKPNNASPSRFTENSGESPWLRCLVLNLLLLQLIRE